MDKSILSIFKGGEQEHSDYEVLARFQTVNYAAETFMSKMVEMFGTEVDSELYASLPPAEQPDNVASLEAKRAERAQAAAQAALDLKAQKDTDYDRWLENIRRDVEAA